MAAHVFDKGNSSLCKTYFTSDCDTTTPSNMGGEYGGFPMSVIVTGFFVTSLAYLICFCCCIIQFFIRRGRQSRNQRGALTSGSPQKNDTLKKRFLKQFRYSLKKFKKNNPTSSTEAIQVATISSLQNYGSCPICFEEYSGDPAEIFIGYLKSCGHYFHFDCIWTWLESRGTCPLCRENVTLTEADVKAVALRHLLDSKTNTLNRDTNRIIENSDNTGTSSGNLSSQTGDVSLQEVGVERGVDNAAFSSDETQNTSNSETTTTTPSAGTEVVIEVPSLPSTDSTATSRIETV